MPQFAPFPMLPAEPLVSNNIPDPPQELRDEDVFFTGKSMVVEPEQAAAAPVEAAGKIATQVITASALEESLAGESGPSLTGGTEAPGQATAEKPVARVETSQAAGVTSEKPLPLFKAPPLQWGGVSRSQEFSGSRTTEVPRAAAMADQTYKLTLLPDWLRHLPDMVASIPATISDPAPATEPTSERTPTPEPAAKPQPTGDRKLDDSWYEPETLIGNLNELANGPAGKWAAAVLRQLGTLKPAIAAGSDEATAILDRLEELSQQTLPLAAKLSDKTFARKWREMGYALARRVDIWRQVAQLGKPAAADSVSPALDATKLAECLANVEAATNDSAEGKAWQAYLLIDDLKQRCVKQSPRDERLSREVAGQALVRMTQIPLTPEQQRLVSSAPLAALRAELWHWAAQPIGIAELLRDIERYERTRLPSDGQRLAIDYQSLLASPIEVRRQLADCVDMHYRNANFRFAVTEQLLNSLIPEQKLEYGQINDTVVGRPVRGDSLMETRIAVQMVPDPHRVLLALVVSGDMASVTTTDAGMAQFHNESASRYVARKQLEINMEGIGLWREVDIGVHSETQLNSLETSVDNVPLINWLVRAMARGQHDMKMGDATEEVKQKIVDKVTERINTETRQRFSEVVDRLNQRVFDPLNSLTLDPQLIDAQTTEKRFTMRLRLGGEDQLGSHTPRPPAPSDSLASLQIHESVINNGIQRLHLDGHTFTLPELSRHVAASLNCPAPWPTDSENDDVKITFARQNSVVIRCQEGQVLLTLSIARLCKGTRYIWHNFQVRAVYQPVVHGRSAELVRENVIQLINKRNMGSQMILRGVFAHALSRKTPWELIPQKIINQPKLQDAAITQFVIEDGWIGLSLGPRLTTIARRPRFGVR